MARPKRKLSVGEIIGNIIIWASPIVMGITLFIANFDVIMNAETSIQVEFWVILVLIGIMFGYTSWGQQALKDELIPVVIAILTLDFLEGICEPIETFLIVFGSVQALGRLVLFFDSFKEAEYYE